MQKEVHGGPVQHHILETLKDYQGMRRSLFLATCVSFHQLIGTVCPEAEKTSTNGILSIINCWLQFYFNLNIVGTYYVLLLAAPSKRQVLDYKH